MKILKSLSVLALFLLSMVACENERKTSETEMDRQENVNPDVVTTRWGDAWKSNQFDSVRNMTADDAVLMINGKEVPKDSLVAWLEWTSTNMRNLEMNSLDKGSEGNVAWDSGTFSHSFADDSTSYDGTYTFIWERTGGDKNDWKARLMHISDNMEMDSLQMQQQNMEQMQ